jgi:hypothetical protein
MLKKHNTIFFNSYGSKTTLCELGIKYGTDKTPFLNYDAYNLDGNPTSHGYTPFYDFLFSNLRYKNISFGEIGIYKNSSMKMWREYFKNAILYGWDCKPEQNIEKRYNIDFVELAKKDLLPNTFYDYMNVKDELSIMESLKKTNNKFDILIDDSDHDFWSQIRIIRSSPPYLKSGGMLIIEDMYHSVESIFEQIKLYGHHKFYDTMTFIQTEHNKKTYGDGIILLIRNEVE